MKPAWSLVAFTTLAGAGQGLASTLSFLVARGTPPSTGLAGPVLALAVLCLVAGLAASFFHLGHPERAWRAALMWRTSWMSREVIVLPAYIALLAAWWLLLPGTTAAHAAGVFDVLPGPGSRILAALVLAGSGLLWVCTAMIYMSIRFIPEWAHRYTMANFVLNGMASGSLLFCLVAALGRDEASLQATAPWALAWTTSAGLVRLAMLRRNARLQPRSSLQTALGLTAPRIVQKSMGMMGGSFNTREFFHGASPGRLRAVRTAFLLGAYLGPIVIFAYLLATGVSATPAATWLCGLAVAVQTCGLWLERWAFLAETSHPQNLYYQTVG